MVRLLHNEDKCAQSVVRQFQSHNGAIAASLSLSANFCKGEFQSHNGAIAAPTGNVESDPIFWFQSHNGAIAAVDIEYLPLHLQ